MDVKLLRWPLRVEYSLHFLKGLKEYFLITQEFANVNPLHPNISMHILHTVLYTFPNLLTGRICLTIKSFFSW